jgi:electron transfer flavoprotein alpha subunit
MSRIRRDPREELAEVTVSVLPLLRIDRAHRGGAGVLVAEALAEAPQRVYIDEPEYFVFAVADAPGGVFSRHDKQVMGAARVLAGGQGALVLLGATEEDAGPLGVDRIITLPAGYDPEGAAAIVAAAVRRDVPRHVLFPESADGGDLARRVAALLGEPLFDNVEALSAASATRPAGARRVEWRGAPTRLMTIAPDMVAPYRGTPHEVEALTPPEAPAPRGILSAAAMAVDAAEIPLGQASMVLSAGNGVSDFQGFLQLARAMRATPGASRVVCDAGLLPRGLQVGASGTVLDADVYIALGISGAPQHLQGIGTVEHVVAVNTDLHAAMIARAELAIIADAQEVMPALLGALRA